MRVVIDTNILVSAVIRDRVPEQVLLWCLENPVVEWVVTPAVMAEYSAVIQRPKFALPAATVTWWLELLASDTRLIAPSMPSWRCFGLRVEGRTPHPSTPGERGSTPISEGSTTTRTL